MPDRKQPAEMTVRDALTSLASWHHSFVSEEGANRVARALGELPAIDGALRVGKLSYAKVRALTRVATPENEAQLLELALFATGAQLERLCRGYRTAQSADEAPSPEARSVRQRLLPGGMVKLEMVLLPDEADLVLRERCLRERTQVQPDHRAADPGTGFSDDGRFHAPVYSPWCTRRKLAKRGRPVLVRSR